MSIQNKTARRIMYDWHSGQFSSLYAAASSGLCASWENLIHDCNTINDKSDKSKLLEWIQKQQTKSKTVVIVQNQAYFILPWVHRSYFPKGE